jgi:glycosyltransferase involved in cell wall biosynthesis
VSTMLSSRRCRGDSKRIQAQLLEAMRGRVPVVVTPEVGAAEVVRESGGGIVAAGDLEPLARPSAG